MLLLQAPAADPDYSQFFVFGAILVIFFFFIILPQQRKQKQAKKFLEALEKGDEVTTIGGIHGRIVSIEDNVVVLEVDRSTRLRVTKTAISAEASATK